MIAGSISYWLQTHLPTRRRKALSIIIENNYVLLDLENSIDADTVPFPPFDLSCFSHGSPVCEKIMSEITLHHYCCFTIGKAGMENKTPVFYGSFL